MDTGHTAKPQFVARDNAVLLINADGNEGNTMVVAICAHQADAEFVAKIFNHHADLIALINQILEIAEKSDFKAISLQKLREIVGEIPGKTGAV